jgi:hypothetical protein
MRSIIVRVERLVRTRLYGVSDFEILMTKSDA